MADDSVKITITATTDELRAQLAVAQAAVRSFNSDVRDAADAMLDLGNKSYQQAASGLAQATAKAASAQAEVAGLTAQLKEAQAAESGAAQAAAGMTGSISTATREFRALFDELSSGRTRMIPGTLAIIAQRVLGMGPAALLATAGVAGLVGGLAYLITEAIDAANAIDRIQIGAAFAGNVQLSNAQITEMVSELKELGVSGSDARSVLTVFSHTLDLTTEQMRVLALETKDFSTSTGQSMDKAAESLSKFFATSETAKNVGVAIGGVTQKQIDAAIAADQSGNANAVFAAKLDIVNSALQRSDGLIDQHNSGVTASITNLGIYAGAVDAGADADKVASSVIEHQNDLRAKQVQLIGEATARLASMPQTSDQMIKGALGDTADLDNNQIAIDKIQGKIAQLKTALDQVQAGPDFDALTRRLTAANQELDNLQLGPVMARARAEIEQLSSTWSGTQSELLAAENTVWASYLASVRSGSAQALAIQTEMGRNEVAERKEVGTEIIANARDANSEIAANASLTKAQQLAQERSVWDALLAGDKLTAAQRVEVERDRNLSIAALNRQEVEDEKKLQEQKSQIDRSNVETSLAIARLNVEAEKSALEEERTAHQINAGQKLAVMEQLTQDEYALDIQQLDNERSTYAQGTVEYTRYTNQILLLRAKLNNDLATLQRQAAQETLQETKQDSQAWKSAIAEITQSETGMIQNLLTRRMTFTQAVESMAQQMVLKEIEQDAKYYTMKALYNMLGLASDQRTEQGGLLVHLMAEEQKLAATVAGNTAQTASSEAASSAQSASTALGAGKEIMTHAASAAAAVYDDVAQIPYVGWILAPVAAGVAFAAVAAFGSSVPSAEGGWVVPGGTNPLTQLHENEMVLPAGISKGLQGMIGGGSSEGGGGSGQQINITIQAVDAKGVAEMFNNNRSALMNTIRSAATYQPSSRP